MIFQNPILDRWRRWDAGSRQKVNAHWMEIAKSDPNFRSVYMTFDLVFGGSTVVRVAMVPLTTTSSIDGAVYQYQQGLVEEPMLDHAVELLSSAAAARSISMLLPADVVNPSDIILQGGMLAGIGEVSLQRDGDDYELRWVLMRGDMTGGISIGPLGEQVQIQLSDPRETQSLKVPDKAVDTDRWPLAAEDAIGMRYPLVINGYPYVPCQRVVDDFGGTGVKFLACAPGRELEVTEAYVNGEVAAGGFAGWVDADTQDAKGAKVKLVDFSAAVGPWEDSDVVYATLSRATGTPALSLIQVLQKLLEGYTGLGRLGLNVDLFSTADRAMPGTAPQILINASGQDAVNVLDFAENTLLSSFPMVYMTYQGRGLGPVVIDRRVGPDLKGVSTILTGGVAPLIERTMLVAEMEKGSIYNEFEVRYGYNAMTNSYSGIVRRDATTTVACQLSQRMVGGVRPMDPIDSPFVQSREQANYIIDWLVSHMAIPSYYVEWTCLPSAFVKLMLGQNVRYTDPNIRAFTNVQATVVRATYSRGGSVLGLRIWHPAFEQLLLGFTR